MWQWRRNHPLSSHSNTGRSVYASAKKILLIHKNWTPQIEKYQVGLICAQNFLLPRKIQNDVFSSALNNLNFWTTCCKIIEMRIFLSIFSLTMLFVFFLRFLFLFGFHFAHNATSFFPLPLFFPFSFHQDSKFVEKLVRHARKVSLLNTTIILLEKSPKGIFLFDKKWRNMKTCLSRWPARGGLSLFSKGRKYGKTAQHTFLLLPDFD